jgi:hypothetical protein
MGKPGVNCAFLVHFCVYEKFCKCENVESDRFHGKSSLMVLMQGHSIHTRV